MKSGKCDGRIIWRDLNSLKSYNGGFKKKLQNGYGRQIFRNGNVFEGIQNDDYRVEGIMTYAEDGF